MVAAELSVELYKNQILEVFWRLFVRPVAVFELKKTLETIGVLSIFHGRHRTFRRALQKSDPWGVLAIFLAAGRGIWAQKIDRNNMCFVNFSWPPPNCSSSSPKNQTLEVFWRFFARPAALSRGIWARKIDRYNMRFVNFSWPPPNCSSSSPKIRS